MNTKAFPIEEVVSCISGRLLCPIGKVYECLNWFFDDNFFTHQLPKAGRTAKPLIEAQHPFLAQINTDHINTENWEGEVVKMRQKYGETVMLTKSPVAYKGNMMQDLDEMLSDK